MGRAANFCGADGLEICEPLTFKGREGSGHPGGRNAYSGTDTAKDWRKFAESYRLWWPSTIPTPRLTVGAAV